MSMMYHFRVEYGDFSHITKAKSYLQKPTPTHKHPTMLYITISARSRRNIALRELHSLLQLHPTFISDKSLPSAEPHQQTKILPPIPPKNLIPPRHKKHKPSQKPPKNNSTPPPPPSPPRRLPHRRNLRIVREQNNPASVASKARNARRAPAVVVEACERQRRCDDHECGVCSCEGFAEQAGCDG